MTARLAKLTAGMPIPYGGDKVARVDAELAAAFSAGDKLIVVQESGALLRVAADVAAGVESAVSGACDAFTALAAAPDRAITAFFAAFAERLADDAVWAKITAANAADVAAARAGGRQVGRLAVSEVMRAEMIAGVRAWRDAPAGRGEVVERIEHDGWTLEQRRAPLGVVGFVFEGRPNVVADAAGVVRGGNAAVLRIGSDALGTARALFADALSPALKAAGLPAATLTLIDSAERAAGWALFSDRRLALAVARGSGAAVDQLGAVARQAGVPVSLHGTGGAWLIADVSADAARFAAAVANSLDRKVCNTLNVCLIVRERAAELAPLFFAELERAGRVRGHGARVHLAAGDEAWRPSHWSGEHVALADEELGREWEWEDTPEASFKIVGDLGEAIDLFNRFSPRLAASLIAEDPAAQDRFHDQIDAPFIGDGFTRWVDGQYAFGRPELGLANWQAGRLFARGAALTGDGVFTLKARMRQHNIDLRR